MGSSEEVQNLLPKQVLYQAELCPDTMQFNSLSRLPSPAYRRPRPLSVSHNVGLPAVSGLFRRSCANRQCGPRGLSPDPVSP